jgi:hypothetical protein
MWPSSISAASSLSKQSLLLALLYHKGAQAVACIRAAGHIEDLRFEIWELRSSGGAAIKTHKLAVSNLRAATTIPHPSFLINTEIPYTHNRRNDKKKEAPIGSFFLV